MASSNTASNAAAMPDLSRYRPALLSYFRKRVHPADVEDLVQDVFLNVHARQAQAPIENMEGYLFAVALSALVRKGRRDRGVIWVSPGDDPEYQALPEAISPERVLLGKESLSKAVQVMDDLPPRTQEVFLLHRFEEMTYPAIAKALGISVSAVEKHIMIALSRLVAGLEGRR
jgi:RNA polymerase sigma factor (sigma-70 family)